MDRWRFPEMGVPRVIIHLNRIVLINIYKPSSYWGSISVVITNDHRVLE